MEQREYSRFYDRIFIFFLAGFLLSLAVIYAGQDVLVKGTDFLDSTSLQRFRMLDSNRMKLFFYSLKVRFLPAVYLIILTFARMGGLSVCVYLVWCGFCAGAVLSVLSLRFGIRGILLFAAGIIPQAVLLIPAYIMLFRWCVLSAETAGGKRSIYHLIQPMLLMAAGCLMEGYLNPWIMEKVFIIL